MIPIYDLHFMHDWNTREGSPNGKLDCSCFTTLRYYNAKYDVNTVHRIYNNHNKKKTENKGYAIVLNLAKFQFQDLEKYDWLCRLDTGYGWRETQNILLKMYNGIKSTDTMCFVLMRYLTKAEIVRLSEKNQTQLELT